MTAKRPTTHGYPRRHQAAKQPRRLNADPRSFGIYPKPALAPAPAPADPEQERRSA